VPSLVSDLMINRPLIDHFDDDEFRLIRESLISVPIVLPQPIFLLFLPLYSLESFRGGWTCLSVHIPNVFVHKKGGSGKSLKFRHVANCHTAVISIK
jgi:hypothetical protein